MADTLRQLGQLFVQAIPTVIFVFLLLILLERLFFGPLLDVLKKREEATRGALARAREEALAAETKTQGYDAAFQAARQEVYRLREAGMKEALGERENALQKAREQAEAWAKEAQGALRAQVLAAQQELEKACQSLALEITEAVLGENPSAGGKSGARL